MSGRHLVNDDGIYRPRWTSGLSLASKSEPEIADFIDWTDEAGYNGFRVFAGALSWAGQTPEMARQRLPFILDYARSKGKYVEVVFLTDTGTGYDKEQHCAELGRIVEQFENTLPEMANEPWHPTQDGETHSAGYLYNLALRTLPAISVDGIPFALGAAENDETITYAGGDFITVHLDRSRDRWNMIRRIREMENLSSVTGKFVMDNEKIKFSSQMDDLAIAFTAGSLDRGFEVGAIVHTDWGLAARRPSPAEAQFDEEFLAGWATIDTDEPLTFKNTGWGDSPVKGFEDGTLVRVYSFVSGGQGYAVALGGEGSFEMQNGWRQAEVIAARPGVRVVRLAR